MNQVTACQTRRANSTTFRYRIGGVRILSTKAVYADSPARSVRSRFRKTSPYTPETTPPSSRSWNPRYRRFRSHHPAGRRHGYSRAIVSPRCSARHEEPPNVPRRREDFQGLDRRRGIDVLRAHDGALADERALPDAGLRVQPREAFIRALVPRVADVSQGQGRRGRSDEPGASAEDRAGRVAQHAVDAQALLPIRFDILRVLEELLGQFARLLADDVRRDGRELREEIVEVHDEVLEDREVRERIDRHRALVDVADVRATREPRRAVHVRPARTTDAHAARPPVRQRGVEVVLDVIQSVEDDHVVPIRDAVLLVRWLASRLRSVPLHPEHDVPPGHVNTSSRRAATS